MNTDDPTFVDIAFASIASIMIIPDNLGGAETIDEEARPRVQDMSKEGRAQVEARRERPSGKFVLKMYQNFRENQDKIR